MPLIDISYINQNNKIIRIIFWLTHNLSVKTRGEFRMKINEWISCRKYLNLIPITTGDLIGSIVGLIILRSNNYNGWSSSALHTPKDGSICWARLSVTKVFTLSTFVLPKIICAVIYQCFSATCCCVGSGPSLRLIHASMRKSPSQFYL